MSILKLIISILGTFPILISCNSTQSIAKIERQQLFKTKAGALEPTLFTAHTDATQRISIIMANSTGKFITFSENPPDAAIQSALGIFGKTDVKDKVTAEAKLDFAKTIIALGKRSEAINFQRDGMFRLVELFNNGGLTGPQLIALIDSLQSRAVQIASFNAGNDNQTTKLEQLKELNMLISKADSTAPKPTSTELIELIKNL